MVALRIQFRIFPSKMPLKSLKLVLTGNHLKVLLLDRLILKPLLVPNLILFLIYFPQLLSPRSLGSHLP